jgi:hypothetical protein
MSDESERDIIDHVAQRLKRDYAVDGTALPEGIARSLQKLRRSETAHGGSIGGQPLAVASSAASQAQSE